jgi:hypothetical protein
MMALASLIIIACLPVVWLSEKNRFVRVSPSRHSNWINTNLHGCRNLHDATAFKNLNVDARKHPKHKMGTSKFEKIAAKFFVDSDSVGGVCVTQLIQSQRKVHWCINASSLILSDPLSSLLMKGLALA